VASFRDSSNCLTVDATLTREQVYEQLRNKLTEVNILPPPPVEMLFMLGGPGSGKGTYFTPHSDNAPFWSRSTASSTFLLAIY
jgi:hypothetical protein